MRSPDTPICWAGTIRRVGGRTGPSPPTDTATHVLQTRFLGPLYLAATNVDAQNALEAFEDSEVEATVCGYSRSADDCRHLDVYYVGPGAGPAPKLRASGPSVIADRV